MRVLYLTPDLFGSHGGIARHCRLAIKALTESPTVTSVDVLALMDPTGTAVDTRYAGAALRSYSACAGSRAQLTRRALARSVRNTYDVVIAQHVNLAPLLFLSLVRSHHARRVTVAHGLDAWTRLRGLRGAALRRCDLVVAVSQFTADATRRTNCVDRSRIRVVYNCLDPTFRVDGAADSAPADQRHVLLTVARLWRSEASKGHSAVLRALPRVAQSIPDISYWIVGEGDLAPDLQQLAISLGLERHVRFLGALSDAELGSCYRQCSAYVMPSKWEGFGLTFLEAMAAGRPVIAGDRDATPEIVGDAALLVDPDDPNGVAEAIVGLLSNPGLRMRLAAAGQRRVESLFTFERFKSRFVKTLEQGTAC